MASQGDIKLSITPSHSLCTYLCLFHPTLALPSLDIFLDSLLEIWTFFYLLADPNNWLHKSIDFNALYKYPSLDNFFPLFLQYRGKYVACIFYLSNPTVIYCKHFAFHASWNFILNYLGVSLLLRAYYNANVLLERECLTQLTKFRENPQLWSTLVFPEIAID